MVGVSKDSQKRTGVPKFLLPGTHLHHLGGVDSQLVPACQFSFQDAGIMQLTDVDAWRQFRVYPRGWWFQHGKGMGGPQRLNERQQMVGWPSDSPEPRYPATQVPVFDAAVPSLHEAILSTVQMVLTNLAAPFWGVLADRGEPAGRRFRKPGRFE